MDLAISLNVLMCRDKNKKIIRVIIVSGPDYEKVSPER